MTKNNLIIKEVDFDGDTLMAVQDAETNKIHVGVKWICEGIGLTQDQMRNERKKIQTELVLSKGGSNLTLPTKGGNQEAMGRVCTHIKNLENFIVEDSNEEFLIMTAVDFSMSVPKNDILDVFRLY